MADIILLTEQIAELREQLRIKEELLREIQDKEEHIQKFALPNEDIKRYSRQIILNEVGVQGQLNIKNGSVLIVGVGGLGCPAALYLVGAGIGSIGLIDYDVVEVNNLHRQLLHAENSIGMSKVDSARAHLKRLNSSCNITTYNIQLNSTNALDIITKFDIILDCTDNVATRYLLNDACVILKKPLVSGSALQLDGQLTVYNYINGPCYRCIFPTPPPPETVTNCGDGGVIGAVPGIIGTMQALEALKIILKFNDVLTGRLLLFDGFRTVFRSVKLRGKRENCDVCSDKPIITRLIDYEIFCGMRASDKDYSLTILDVDERISVRDYSEICQNKTPHTLVDVRSSNEFEICHIPNSVNIPINDILSGKDFPNRDKLIADNLPVYVICRRGNDSQLAVKNMQAFLNVDGSGPRDIIGGLHAWSRDVDNSFPIY